MNGEQLFFTLITFFDVLGAIAITIALLKKSHGHYSLVMRASFIVLTLGLIAQAFRNILFLATGQSPSDSDLPLWALKDIGIVLAFYKIFHSAHD